MHFRKPFTILSPVESITTIFRKLERTSLEITRTSTGNELQKLDYIWLDFLFEILTVNADLRSQFNCNKIQMKFKCHFTDNQTSSF